MPNPDATTNETANVSQPDSGMVLVGDEANAVSAQVFQSIYNEITGKSETVGKSYDQAFEITFSDVEQLHHKIKQAHEQYHVCASNCVVTIYYLNNTRDRFSSFERFSMHNAGSVSPVESIVLKYSLLIILPKVDRPQTYTISIRFISRVAREKRMASEGMPHPTFYRIVGIGSTARVEIEYVDYMVARNFLGLIDDWFGVLPFNRGLKLLKFLQHNSHWVPKVAQFTTTIIAVVIVIQVYPRFVSAERFNLGNLGTFALVAGLGIYVAHTLAEWCGDYVEYSLDRWSELSYLKLNKGDEAEIRKSMKENRWYLVRASIGFVCTLSISVVTKIIASAITASFGH